MEIIKRTIKLSIFLVVLFAGIIWFAQPANALWVYEQKFNTLNDGDLNGQDSWSGSVNFDVTTDDNYDSGGSKCVKIASAPSNDKIGRSVTKCDSDGSELYIAMKSAVTTNISGVDLGTATKVAALRIQFSSDGHIYFSGNDWGTYSANKWYVVKITFDFTNNRYDANVYEEGTGWGTPLTNLTPDQPIGTGITRMFLGPAYTIVDTFYYDTITPTDPTPPPVAEEYEGIIDVPAIW